MSTETKKRSSTYWIHVAITLLIMIGFGFLPGPGPITHFGMQMLGIFFGMVYGWSTLDQIWPSLFGLVMLALTDYNTIENVLIEGWGSSTVFIIILVLIFSQAISDAGISRWLAIKAINHKIFFGRPWLFTAVLIFTAFLLSALTGNAFVGMLIMWAITYDISSIAGYKKKDAWPSITIIGITLASIIGMGSFPYMLVPLMVFTAYQNLGGPAINYGSYVIVCWGSLFLIIVLYLLINKFLLRVNIDKIAGINEQTFENMKITLDKRQKVLFAIFVVMLISFLVSHMLPASLPVVGIMAKLGLAGLSAIFVGLAMFIKIDDKPLLDFQAVASHGVIWAAVILTAAALPISTAITAEGTGVQEFLIGVLVPFFQDKPVIIFAILMLGLTLLMTNLANNAVTALIFMAVVVSVAGAVGANATAMVVLLTITAHIAVLTPAACPMAGVMFSNKEWLEPKTIYKQAAVLILISIVVICSYGYIVANMLF